MELLSWNDGGTAGRNDEVRGSGNSAENGELVDDTACLRSVVNDGVEASDEIRIDRREQNYMRHNDNTITSSHEVGWADGRNTRTRETSFVGRMLCWWRRNTKQ